MDIIIHTAGRVKFPQQHTLRYLHEAGIRCTLVVQQSQVEDYAKMIGPHDLYCLPPYVKRLAETRDHIIHDMPGSDHVVFMDDDLDFAVRRSDDRTKFRQVQPGDLEAMFSRMDRMLLACPMVGIGSREGGNRVVEPEVYNTRIMRVLGFRRSFLKERHLTFSPLVVMEDFHINLQILRAGQDTCVLNNWVSNQHGGSDAPGGCSVYRTADVQTESAKLLASRHPGFVKVVEKTTKTAWGGGTRTDVIVSWKRARASAGEL